MSIIYKVENTTSGKVYIGKTIKSLKERKQKHLNDSKYNRDEFCFHNAIRKHVYGGRNQ